MQLGTRIDTEPSVPEQAGQTTVHKWWRRLMPFIQTWRLAALALVATLPYSRFNDVEFSGLGALGWLALWFFPLVALHELGHVLAARHYGVRLQGLSLGPFKLDWRDGPLSVRLSPHHLAGGQVLLEIPDPRDFAHRAFWITLWGPLVNLILAVLSYLLLLQVETTWSPAALAALFTFSAMNAAIALINVVPTFDPGTLLTDGDALMMLAKPAQRESAALTLGMLSNLMVRGQLSAVWQAAITGHPFPERGLGAYLQGLVEYQTAWAAGDFRQARQAAEQMKRASPSLPPVFAARAQVYAALAAPEHLPPVLGKLERQGRKPALEQQGLWFLALAAQAEPEMARQHAACGLVRARQYQQGTLSALHQFEIDQLKTYMN